ncbi:hypothetical protein [Actinomadura atramentaria]|uniref:hypothetical protein n=1 Tax=Actinomadura atramentaria TaxID=1990 RepID=UPI000382DADD|nr:hypothetical protein [Actinomadura atramentaria]
MAEPPDIDVAEIQSLRQEITARIGFMNAIIGLELAAAGTGLTLLHQSGHVLGALAAVSSFLWLLWMDQCLSSYKIAAYLAVDLAPRLSAAAGRPVLGWETFLRRVESGRAASARALSGAGAPRAAGLIRAVRSDWYVPLLFAAVPLGLLGFYTAAMHDHRVGTSAGTVIAAFAGAMWLLALIRFADFVRSTHVLDRAITASGDALPES